MELIPKVKSGIHIKKENKGKFTKYCNGKVTSECIARGKKSNDPAVRKRATFAANARKWKHESGSKIHKPTGHNLDNVVGNGWTAEKQNKKKLIKKHNIGGGLNFSDLMTSFQSVDAESPDVLNSILFDQNMFKLPAIKKVSPLKTETPVVRLNPADQPLDFSVNSGNSGNGSFSINPGKSTGSISVELDKLKTMTFDKLLLDNNIDARITSGYRPGSKTKQGKPSHHSIKDQYGRSQAYDIVPTNGKTFDQLRLLLLTNVNVRSWMKANNFGLLDETSSEMLARTGGTGLHFHIGMDNIALEGWNKLLKQYNIT